MFKNFNIIILTLVALSIIFIPYSNCKSADEINILYFENSGFIETYDNISNAIDIAENGDTIFVHPGVYCENFAINKSINLIGSDKNNTVIECQKHEYGLLVLADQVNISGFTIQNATIGIYLKSSKNTIENNIFQNNSNAVFIKDTSNNNVSSNIFKSNTEGIYIYNSTGNNIFKNLILDDSYFGIKFLEKSSKNIFSFNKITDCIRCVTIDRWSNNNSISNNNFSTIQESYCVNIKNSFNNHILNNSFYNWSRAITLIKSQNNTINNNKFYNNEVGIFLEDAEFNDVSEDNIFLDNDIDITTKSKPPSIKIPGFEVSILIIIAFLIMLIFFFRLRKS